MMKEPVITDEGREIIQYSQSMTRAITKLAMQTVGSLLKAQLLGRGITKKGINDHNG